MKIHSENLLEQSKAGIKCKALLLLLLLQAISFFQPADAQQDAIKFDHLGMEDGLSESIVLSIAQDKQGYMWFGTADGLNRYDGNTFKTFYYNALDSTSLSHSYIQILYVDSRGILWIGTARGLDWFDAQREQFHHIALSDSGGNPSKKDFTVHSIIEDKAHALWIGTAGNGMFHLDVHYDSLHHSIETKAIKRYGDNPDDPNDLNGTLTCPVYIDSSGNVWISTRDAGVSILDPATGIFKHIVHDPKNPETIPTNRVTTICIDPQKKLWIGTEDKGLYRFTNEEGKYKHYLGKGEGGRLSNDVIRGHYCDTRGREWVATDGGGLLLYNPTADSFTVFSHDPSISSSLSNNRVICIYEDRAGTIWFGTWGAGVDRWSPVKNKFTNNEETRAVLNYSSSDFIVSIFEDRKNNLWVGTHGGGIISVNRETGKLDNLLYHPQKPKGIMSGVVWSTREDKEGNLWFATDRGVDEYLTKEEKFNHYDEELPKGRRLSSRYAGRAEPYGNNVWVSTEIALDKINTVTGEITNFPYKLAVNDTLQGFVSGVYIDRNGILWLGTTPIVGFDTHTEKYIDRGPDIGQSPVSCIVGDSKNNLWAGTFGAGVYVFDSSFALIGHFLISDGLPNNVVYGVLEGENGDYWLSTNHGISKFNFEKKTFRNYDVADGLQGNEFNRCAYFKDKKGMMYFGGVNGYNAFFPQEITDNHYIPPVVLTEFRKFNEPVRFEVPFFQLGEITLNYNENFFSFEFSSLDFVEPGKNVYAYMLEGFDKQWVFCGKNRLANYTNVEPGEYTFRVKGSNNDGRWNEAGTAIRIVIPPPFWKTYWFIGLVALTGISAFGGTVRFISTQKLKRKIEQLEREKAIQEERQRTREQIARDLHDDLASTVGSAGFFVESVKRQLPDAPRQAIDFLDKTGSLLTEAEQAMSDIVWSVSPQHDSFDSLLLRIRLLTTDICKANGIKYEIDVQGNETNINLPDDVRRNIYLIFKESLSNAVRYASAQLINVRVVLQDEILILEISDNGKGFPEARAAGETGQGSTRGNGLRNMRTRAKEIGAELTIVSGEGKGTKVQLKKRITQSGH